MKSMCTLALVLFIFCNLYAVDADEYLIGAYSHIPTSKLMGVWLLNHLSFSDKDYLCPA
jgi:hypothetical protein